MPDHNAQIVLSASDGRESSVAGRVSEIPAGIRFRRVALTVAISILLALAMVPIPIVHFIGVPLVLFGGIGAAIWQGRQVARVDRVVVPCPCCGAANPIGGGPGFPSARGPFQHPCANCRLPLTLRFIPD